jgi:hypothetical protein
MYRSLNTITKEENHKQVIIKFTLKMSSANTIRFLGEMKSQVNEISLLKRNSYYFTVRHLKLNRI